MTKNEYGVNVKLKWNIKNYKEELAMVLTASNMMNLGTKAPNFELRDAISDKKMGLQQFKSDHATVIAFICNHCPYVKHIQKELVKVAKEYQAKKIQFVAISSNDIDQYPEDGPIDMKLISQQFGYPFPYLFDDTQNTAKAYDAACTPDFYIFDKNLICVYRGRFDDSTPGNMVPVTGKDLKGALDNILAGKPVDIDQKPSIGCNIKWKE